MRIYKVLTVLLLGLFTSAAAAAPDGWSPLLEAPALNAVLTQSPQVRVIQVTGDYASAHIPGSVHAPYAEFRGPQDNQGQLPPLPQLSALVQRLGIAADTPVAIVHQGNSPVDMGAATRVYWTLKSLGITDLTILNGGFAAWQAAGLPVSTTPTTVAASGFEPVWNDQWTLHTAEVEHVVANKSARLIDGRPAAFFDGTQSVAARAGTIKGAENISFTSFFDDNSMKPAGDLSTALAAASLSAEEPVVTFCNSGHMGSINWFVMSEMAAMQDVKLYAESITEWAQSPQRPMDNER